MEELRRAIDHARKAGDSALLRTALSAGHRADRPAAPRASELGEWLRELSEEPGAFVASRVRLGEIKLARLEGRFDDGRESARVARDSIEQLGQHTMIASCCYFPRAARAFRPGTTWPRARPCSSPTRSSPAQDERSYRSTRQAELARDLRAARGPRSRTRGSRAGGGARRERGHRQLCDHAPGPSAAGAPRRRSLGAERWARSAVEIAVREGSFR